MDKECSYVILQFCVNNVKLNRRPDGRQVAKNFACNIKFKGSNSSSDIFLWMIVLAEVRIYYIYFMPELLLKT